MPRSLRELDVEERLAIIAAIHIEAEAAGWHTLGRGQPHDAVDRLPAGVDAASPPHTRRLLLFRVGDTPCRVADEEGTACSQGAAAEAASSMPIRPP